MSWSIREHQQEPDRLAHLLYWQELVTPSVVWQKDGSLLSVMRYRGPDMESATTLELQILTQRVHELLQRYDAGWSIHVEARRHQASPYPVSTWTHPVAALVDEERRAQVGMPGSHFETTYHLSLTYHPPKARQSWWHNLWWEHVPKGHAQIDAVVHFEEDIERLVRGLSNIMHEATLLTNTTLVTYLKSTVSMATQQVRMSSPAWYLDTSLTDMPLLPGATPRLGEHWLRLTHIKNTDAGYPDTSYPGMLDVLHDLPLEYRYVVRWLPMERSAARRHLRLLERIHKGPEGEAAQYAIQANNAREMLEEGTVTFGYLTQTIVVWDRDFAVADEKRKLVEHALQSQGFVAGCETLNSVESWLGTIPGDCYHNVRKPLLHSLNLVHLMPTTSVWAGPDHIPHLQGPPLLVGTARGETPFRLTTHDGDVGHTLILGPTGSGKSSLIAFMALQWDRYHGRVVAFDKGQSLRCATAAMEGSWINMAPGETSPLQPLVTIDQEQERAWAAEWIGDLLTLETIVLTVSRRKEIWTALTHLAGFDERHRTISGLVGLLQSSELRQALAPYTMDGAYGALVDGESDDLTIQRWQCFEMETLLQTPRIVPAMLGVIFHRVENALEGTPTLLLLDEAWVYLDTPLFAARIREWLKTFRRKNCAVVFSTQSLADTQDSPIAAAVNESCVTRIFCPNPRALEPGIGALYANYDITERQRELIALAISKREYYYQGREGQRLFKLELGPVAQAFCGRSRVEDLARIRKVQQAEEPFGVAWLREEGMPDMADTLKQSYDKETHDEDTVPVHYALDPFVVA